jgi:hypothetical protein
MNPQHILLLFMFFRRVIPHTNSKTISIGNEEVFFFPPFLTLKFITAFEALRTLRHLIQGMDEQQLLLNNQIFWCLVSCLYTNNIILLSELLLTLSTILDRLDFQSSAVQNVYLASIPEV